MCAPVLSSNNPISVCLITVHCDLGGEGGGHYVDGGVGGGGGGHYVSGQLAH